MRAFRSSAILHAAHVKPFKPTTLPRAPSTPPQQPRRPFGKTALVLSGVALASIPVYCIFVYSSYRREVALGATRNVPADVSDRYQRTAEYFDEDVGTMEMVIGMNKLRKQLVSKAKGHVLEASVGTGRNMAYLPLLGDGAVTSVTMVDQSSEMVRVARKKWTDTNPWFIHTTFRVQSAAEPVPSPAGDGFDTVIQTMGVCSTPEPEAVLRNLGRLTKQDGRILLLEHGRSYYGWLNEILDNLAPSHADRHGCWWNKDIGAIVERSGLEVVEAKRFHFGTTWWFELKPGKTVEVEEAVAAQPPKATSWNLWPWNK